MCACQLVQDRHARLPASWPCVGTGRPCCPRALLLVVPRMQPAAGMAHANRCRGGAVQVAALLRQQPKAALEEQAEDEQEDARWWAPYVSTLLAYCKGEALILLPVDVW